VPLSRPLRGQQTAAGEQVFAKLKHHLRKAAARTVQALHEANADILDKLTPDECQNSLRNSEYAS